MIRKYNEQDLDDLLAAWAAASEISHPFLTSDFLASERENIPNVYLPNAETWVFEDGGRVVGFVALLGNEIGAIFVHPSHSRKGIGRGLVSDSHFPSLASSSAVSKRFQGVPVAIGDG